MQILNEQQIDGYLYGRQYKIAWFISNDLAKFNHNAIFNQMKFVFSDPDSREAPTEPPTHHNDARAYNISPERLKELRSHFLYWFFDKGGVGTDEGDYQRNIHASNAQLHKNFNFQLPFYGFRFNYTRVSFFYRPVIAHQYGWPDIQKMFDFYRFQCMAI